MAVSRPSFLGAMRALIGAHLLASVNAATRDAGKVLAGFAAVLTALAVGALSLVTIFMFGSMGAIAAASTARQGSSAAAWFFTVMPVVLALLAMMGGDARTLDWEKLKPYPVPRAPLFFAEVLASLTNPFTLIGLLCLGSFAVGLGLFEHSLAPRLLLVVTTAFALTLSLRALIASGALWLVNHLQFIMLVAMMALPALAFALIDFEHPDVDSGTADLLSALGWQVLPAGWQLAGTHPLGAWSVLLLPAGFFALAYKLAFREVMPGRASVARPEKLWSFRLPVFGLARVAVRSIWATDLGRFTMLSPGLWVLSVVLIRQKLSTLPGMPAIDPSWLWLGAWVMTPNMLTNLVLNQFGPDRGAVKALMLLPVTDRQLLRGKALGLYVIGLGNAAVLAPIAWFVVRPSWAVTLAGPLTGYTIFTLMVAAGQFTSVLWPRPLPRKVLKPPAGNLVVGLVAMGILLGSSVPIGLVWWALHDRPLGLFAALAAIALGTTALFWATSQAAEQFLALRRERLVETLS